MVVAHRDPGVPNWIDAAGLPTGMVFWRFLLPEENPPPIETEVVDVATLRALGARHGFRVIEAPSVSWGGEIVSSTRIREALAAGNLELAAALLGGFYEIEGVPVGGKGRGRDLGFPTANLDPGDELLLPYGVYAADVSLPSLKKPEAPFFRAVVHYGPRPTFREDAPSLEVHIVGFSGAVSRVRLRFLRFLRGVRAFAGRESLRRQLERDVAEARGLTAFPAAESLSQPAEAVLAG